MERRTMHAADMSGREATAYVDSFRLNAKRACACEHGHFDCAAYEDGPCVDELINRWPTLAR